MRTPALRRRRRTRAATATTAAAAARPDWRKPLPAGACDAIPAGHRTRRRAEEFNQGGNPEGAGALHRLAVATPERNGDDGLAPKSAASGRAAGARATRQNPQPRTRDQADSNHTGRENQEQPDARTTGATPRVKEQAETATAGVSRDGSTNLPSVRACLRLGNKCLRDF